MPKQRYVESDPSMDFTNPRVREFFFKVHSGLPREGPGNRASMARALVLCGQVSPNARVLDIACGPGRQTIDLAELMPGASFTAVDNHRPFVDEANRRFEAAGLTRRVTAVEGDMKALAFPPASFDLIWCEGAAYIMGGVEAALKTWRPLLKPGGRVALSEAIWLRADPPKKVRRFWAEDFTAITDIDGCRARVAEAGYRLLGDFVLPEEAWWDDYYRPMQARLEGLASTFEGDPVGQQVIDSCLEEIELYREFSAYYGYVFLVMEPAS
jgi:SAM-dependent methyltransferase